MVPLPIAAAKVNAAGRCGYIIAEERCFGSFRPHLPQG
jgi:hypothetical protein